MTASCLIWLRQGAYDCIWVMTHMNEFTNSWATILDCLFVYLALQRSCFRVSYVSYDRVVAHMVESCLIQMNSQICVRRCLDSLFVCVLRFYAESCLFWLRMTQSIWLRDSESKETEPSVSYALWEALGFNVARLNDAFTKLHPESKETQHSVSYATCCL